MAGRELFSRVFLGEFSRPFENKTNKVASEIHNCIEYFEDHMPNKKHGEQLKLIHGIGITVGRLEANDKGYYWEIAGVVKRAGKDAVSQHEYEEVIQEIHHITFPYAEHVRTKSKRLVK